MPLSPAANDRAPTLPRAHQRQRRLRILIICPEPPAPPSWGFALRVYNLGRELSRRHEVALLTYDTHDATRDWVALSSLFRVHRVGHRSRRRRSAQLRSLFTRTSFHLNRFKTTAMQRAILDLAAGEPFDIIQVESSQMFGFDFPAEPAIVLDEHNIEHDLVRRVAQVERSPARRQYLQIECRKVHREEMAAWRRADGCVLTSATDERLLHGELPDARTRVVPNAVDLEYFSPTGAAVNHNNIVFVGAINYRPNADAAVYLATRILPLVQRARPQATLTIVGAGAESLRHLRGRRDVHLTGPVADVRPYVVNAAVATAPLRMGGGTRLKVLEGLAMAKAIVSTTIGCEGLDVRHDRELLVGDDANTFADHLLRVMADDGLRLRLGAAGRRLVEERYSWAAVTEELERFYWDLIRERGRIAA